MKKYLSLILALCCVHICTAQSILTGKINGVTENRVELNRSRDVWYQPGNSVYSNIADDGTFTFSVPGKDPVFVTLRYNQKAQQLLLSPGRPLHITFNADDLPGTVKYTGKGAAENMMIHAFFPPRPFFMKEFSSKNEYGKMGKDSLVDVLLPSIMREADSLRQIVTKSPIPAGIKTSLNAHIKYYYALNMDEFTIVLDYTKNPAAQPWLDTLMQMTGLPSIDEMDRTPYAGYFLSAYAKHQMTTIGWIYRKDKEKGRQMLEDATGLPFDSLRNLGTVYGDEMITMLLIEKKIPPAQHERLLSNRLIYYSNAKELGMARKLQSLLTGHFAGGKEAREGNQRIARLESLLEEGRQDEQIAIRNDYTKISSVDELLAPYKGKIVYLDIWGTWCGPCKAEMSYVPELKTQMKGKDVVFLYLSNDKDNADEKWKEYIRVNKITGEHVRMPEDRIRNIWEALLPGEEVRSYPTFFIFDRDGKVAVKKAKRPSDGEVLYTQLQQYM